jgi:hypothetical protein
MRFRFKRGRRPKTVDAVVEAAPAGAATDPAAVPKPAKAPAETDAEPKRADRWTQAKSDPETAAELSPEKLDRALKRLRTEIPATDDDGSR